MVDFGRRAGKPLHAPLIGQSDQSAAARTYERAGGGGDDGVYKIVHVNAYEANLPYNYCDNFVRTAKYTWWNFLAKFGFISFSKAHNIYFLVVSIFQAIPPISPTDGLPLQLLPLSFVIVVDGILELWEDKKRGQADKEANAAPVQRFCSKTEIPVSSRGTPTNTGGLEVDPRLLGSLSQPHGSGRPASGIEADPSWVPKARFVQSEWNMLQVGDIVKLHDKELVPCDLLIIAVGKGSSNAPGVCYVQTRNLDGESNLKFRQALDHTKHIDTAEGLDAMKDYYCRCELPNANINSFSATLHADDQVFPVDENNVILRGCTLRNTPWVYGVVINSGHDTKIMLSIADTPHKQSYLDKTVSFLVVLMLVFMLGLCFIGATLIVTVENNVQDGAWYLEDFQTSATDYGHWLLTSLYYFTLMSAFVPISLFVSMVMIRAFQSYFMVQDLGMYDEETDTRMKVRNMGLNEELGTVSHIFSDKTGTLTCNKMEFKKLCVGGVDYGEIDTSKKGLSEFGATSTKDSSVAHPSFVYTNGLFSDTDEGANAVRLREKLAVTLTSLDKLKADVGGASSKEQQRRLGLFFRGLSLCHTVVITNEEVGGKEEGDTTLDSDDDASVQMSSSSPDELALVTAADAVGFSFKQRDDAFLEIELVGKSGITEKERWEIVENLDFTSSRRRMSVILVPPQDAPCKEEGGGEVTQTTERLGGFESDPDAVYVFCKGADGELFNRLDRTALENSPGLLRQFQGQLHAYASEGLRTLVVAYKKVDRASFEEWQVKYKRATSDLAQISRKRDGKDNDIDKLQNEMENNLVILGVTAIEDRLQEGVPETIHALRKAGIKIWMLTGDKLETAMNISLSCKLLNGQTDCLVISKSNCATAALMEENLRNFLHSGEYDKGGPQQLSARNFDDAEDKAIIIEGDCLPIVLSLMPELFLEVCERCKAVVACRTSPKQKAEMVRLIRSNIADSRTLSIGDGANDVSMIQEAHIGVGIMGQEGLQAVNSSDYAFAKFKFLGRLLLVHGRWHYRRMSIQIIYQFYKNMSYTVTMFLLAVYPGAFSGTVYFNILWQNLYNLAYTSFPIISLSVFDKDVTAEAALDHPKLYRDGLREKHFSIPIFFAWIVAGLYESLVLWIAVVFLHDPYFNGYGEGNGNRGTSYDLHTIGTTAWNALIWIVTIRVLVFAKTWNVYLILMIALSMVIWLGTACFIDILFFEDILIYNWGLFPAILADTTFWLVMVWAVAMTILPHLAYIALQREFYPEESDIVEEMEGKQHLPQTRHRNSSLLGLFAPSNCYLQEPYQDGNDSVDILQVFDDNASILSQSSRVSSFKASAVTFNN
jgi:phospholipid-translocating P-type ATPase (flippase)